MQVYRGMDIGTAKPTLAEREALPCHLVDIRDPSEQYNAGDFVREAEAACEDIASRGKLPVVAGGTGFYIKCLIAGIPACPPSDSGIRAALKAELAQKGAAALARELAEQDPTSAARIHSNDQYRLLRALEVFRLTGKPLSAFAAQSRASPFRCLVFGLDRERGELYQAIERRCAAMFKAGLPDEVRALFNAGYTPDCPGLKAIGYREFFTRDAGGAWSLVNKLPAVEALIVQNSRHYAKRQITFCKGIPGLRWISGAAELSAALESALREAEQQQ
jgi:tRNA dimethylallyltransferase